MAEITLTHVKKIYDKSVVAVQDFCMEIQDKEFIVLVGPSGCGKSTTLRMIAGLEEISAGEIAIGGKVVNRVPPKDRDIAMVFQDYALYPHMTVYDNIAYGLKLRKFPRRVIDQKVREAAEILDITDLLKRKPKALSGGQRQRVAIGRAIVRSPKAFLMDEPLSNLDAKLRNQMRTEIIKLRQRIQTTFVYVTHDQTEAMTLGDRIVIMKEGYVQQIGTPRQVFHDPNNLFVAGFIGTPQMNFFHGELHREGETDFLDLGGTRLEIAEEKQKNLRQYDVPAQPVVAGIRPEHVLLTEGEGFSGQVDVIEMMGSNTHLHVRFGDEECVIVVPDGDEPVREFQHGETVQFMFHADRIHLFSRETEQNLEHAPAAPAAPAPAAEEPAPAAEAPAPATEEPAPAVAEAPSEP